MKEGSKYSRKKERANTTDGKVELSTLTKKIETVGLVGTVCFPI